MQRQKGSGNQNQLDRSWVNYKIMVESLTSLCDETEMVLLLDSNGTIQFINEKAAQKKYNENATKLIGKSIWKVLEPEVAEQRKVLFHKVLRAKKSVRFIDERNGAWLDSMVYPLSVKDGKVRQVLVLARDITHIKEKEKEIERMNQELEQRVAERTADLEKNIEDLRRAEEILSRQKKDLEDLNITLRVLLQKKEEDRYEITQNVLSNMQLIILPYLGRLLETNLNPEQKQILKLVYDELSTISAPFSYALLSGNRLSPKDIQIADLIREGLTTKEIAKFLHLSEKTIEAHRAHIREKLGLHGRKSNLRTHLLSLH